jgi:hypothetical protein
MNRKNIFIYEDPRNEERVVHKILEQQPNLNIVCIDFTYDPQHPKNIYERFDDNIYYETEHVKNFLLVLRNRTIHIPVTILILDYARHNTTQEQRYLVTRLCHLSKFLNLHIFICAEGLLDVQPGIRLQSNIHYL